jgi:GAF domain-containing protein
MSGDDSWTSPVGTGADREQLLAETFVLLADTLVDDYDALDLLDRLVRASVDLLGVSAAGLLLDDQRGSLAVLASSSEQSRLLEVFQLQSDEGPCLDCFRTGAAVTSGDLDADHARWPLFVPAALAAGFRSVTAVPLRLRNQTIGGLNLFAERPEPISPQARRLAQALADVATIGILQQRSAQRSSMLAEQLQHALDSRVVIEQAKGVLAERNNLSMDAAFHALRSYARARRRNLTQVALDVVHAVIDPSTIGSGSPIS